MPIKADVVVEVERCVDDHAGVEELEDKPCAKNESDIASAEDRAERGAKGERAVFRVSEIAEEFAKYQKILLFLYIEVLHQVQVTQNLITTL